MTSANGIQVYDLGTCEMKSFSTTPGSVPVIAVDFDRQKIYSGGSHEGQPAIIEWDLDGSKSDVVVQVMGMLTDGSIVFIAKPVHYNSPL